MVVSYPIPIREGSEFPLDNIPFGIFSLSDSTIDGDKPRAGTAIGDYVVDLNVLAQYGLFEEVGCDNSLDNVFAQPTLNALATFSAPDRKRTRKIIIELLSDGKSGLFADASLNSKAFIPLKAVKMHMPMEIKDYSDSFGSLIHAKNALAPFGLPMPEAWFQFPMAYNGRTGGVAQSGVDVVRPTGFYSDSVSKEVLYQPTRQLDFEIALALFVAQPLAKGQTVTAREAADHIFGYVLHNDWSARDIQKYEMAPLGVFNSKSFLTSISPWVVTLDALKSSVCDPPPSNKSKIHSMLVCDESNHGLFDIELPAKISRNGDPAVEVTRVNHKDSWWSPFQMFAYHSLSGCGLNTGDLISTGTISSPAPPQEDREVRQRIGTYGCLTEPYGLRDVLPDVGGKPLIYLEDGDRLTIEGWFKTGSGVKAGFGPLQSLVLPSASE